MCSQTPTPYTKLQHPTLLKYMLLLGQHCPVSSNPSVGLTVLLRCCREADRLSNQSVCVHKNIVWEDEASKWKRATQILQDCVEWIYFGVESSYWPTSHNHFACKNMVLLSLLLYHTPSCKFDAV